MWSSNHFSISSCFPRFSASRIFRVQVFRDLIGLIGFQGLGFSGSRLFRLQAQSPCPGLESRFQKQPLIIVVQNNVLRYLKQAFSVSFNALLKDHTFIMSTHRAMQGGPVTYLQIPLFLNKRFIVHICGWWGCGRSKIWSIFVDFVNV